MRLLYKRIFNVSSAVVVESEKKCVTKLEIALDEERGTLDRCEAEIVVRRSRVAWLEKVQGDELGDSIFGDMDWKPFHHGKAKLLGTLLKGRLSGLTRRVSRRRRRLMIILQKETPWFNLV